MANKTDTELRPPTIAEAAVAVAKYEQGITLPSVPTITTRELYTDAAEALKQIKSDQDHFLELRKSLTAPLDQTKKGIMALFEPVMTRLGNRELAIKGAIKDYNLRQRMLVEKVEAAAREAQRKEEARLQARADKLREQGKEERADAVEASIPPVPIIVADSPKVAGINERTIWKAEVTDMKAFLTHVIESGSFNMVDINQSAINSMARALKKDLNVPGLKAVASKEIAAGRA